MTDEKYTFIQDLREKKATARGAFYKRTHCGKGGKVKFATDFMSKKELEAMNGETTTYQLNKPMKWKEFNNLPDDIKRIYLTSIQEKYGAPVLHLAKMFGCHRRTIGEEAIRLGLGRGRDAKRKGWDEKGFYTWINKQADEETEQPKLTESFERDTAPMLIASLYQSDTAIGAPAIPCEGSMTFNCAADKALAVVSQILGESIVKIQITWQSSEEGNHNGE